MKLMRINAKKEGLRTSSRATWEKLQFKKLAKIWRSDQLSKNTTIRIFKHSSATLWM